LNKLLLLKGVLKGVGCTAAPPGGMSHI